MCLSTLQAGGGDLLHTGQEPGAPGRLLLHAGGLRRAHQDDDGLAREPQVAAGDYHVVVVMYIRLPPLPGSLQLITSVPFKAPLLTSVNVLLLMVSSSLCVSHMFVTRVLSSLVFHSCSSLELVSPLQDTHLSPVWDLLLPLA